MPDLAQANTWSAAGGTGDARRPIRPHGSPEPERARLSAALLLYYVGVIGLVTLSPFRPAPPDVLRVSWLVDWTDVVANVAFFLPIGFLYPLVWHGVVRSPIWSACLLGALLSLTVEFAQLWLPGRYPSGVDLATNSAGAALGAMLQVRLDAAFRRNSWRGERLLWQLPLMGLLYLLVPLVWLASASVSTAPVHLVSIAAIGLFGARLWASLQDLHFGPAGFSSTGRTVALASGWMLVGTLPSLVFRPLGAFACAGAVGAATWYFSERARIEPPADRRFEVPALRRAAPFFALYLLGMAFLGWREAIRLGADASELSILSQLQFLERMAALSLVGYMTAEVRGRLELPFADSVRILLLVGGLVSVALGVGRGWGPAHVAAPSEVALMLVSCVAGGWIYHLQRDLIRKRFAVPGHAPARDSGVSGILHNSALHSAIGSSGVAQAPASVSL